MKAVSFPSMYFYWHYSQSLFAYFSFSGNIIWFLFNFFSIGLLLRTLPSPWKRLSEDAYGGRDRNIATDFLVQFLMRLVGFVVRTITIAIGLVSIIVTTVLLAVFFIVWVFLPFVIVIALVYGLIEILVYLR